MKEEKRGNRRALEGRSFFVFVKSSPISSQPLLLNYRQEGLYRRRRRRPGLRLGDCQGACRGRVRDLARRVGEFRIVFFLFAIEEERENDERRKERLALFSTLTSTSFLLSSLSLSLSLPNPPSLGPGPQHLRVLAQAWQVRRQQEALRRLPDGVRAHPADGRR